MEITMISFIKSQRLLLEDSANVIKQLFRLYLLIVCCYNALSK